MVQEADSHWSGIEWIREVGGRIAQCVDRSGDLLPQWKQSRRVQTNQMQRTNGAGKTLYTATTPVGGF